MVKTFMPLILALAVVLFGVMLWQWNRDRKNKFSLLDYLCKEGRASISKTGQFAALCVSTWAFVYLTQQGKLTESYFTLYIATWATAKAVDKGLDIISQQKGTKP